MAVEQTSRHRRDPERPRDRTVVRPAEEGQEPRPLAGRLGLSVPNEWWAPAPLLKSYEAAGFDLVQVHSPPVSVLAVARLTTMHAVAAAEALATTSLDAVVHAPSSLRAGERGTDRAFQNLLSYAAEIGAGQVVYHALALPEGRASEPALVAETRSLRRLARVAEQLGVTIAVENLAPLYPGPEFTSANPILLRGLVRRIDSPAVRICLDVGHAHISADLRNTSVELLCEPVIDLVSLLHLHDNLGARRRIEPDRALGVDPLRLDLHLPPGRGTVPWARVAPILARTTAPLVLEVHPPFRPRSGDLRELAERILA